MKGEDLSTSTVVAKAMKVESSGSGGGGASVAALLAGDEAGCSDYEEELMDEDGRIPQEGDPDFVETTCRWGNCQCQFDSQDELVKVPPFTIVLHPLFTRLSHLTVLYLYYSMFYFAGTYQGQLCACVHHSCLGTHRI